jgi:CspA family cold shock protein
MNTNMQACENELPTHQKISKAKLKWFNAAKGFGFVVPDDNPVDAFLHITQLQKLGIHALGEGAEVLCMVEYREKGATVSELIEVITVGRVPEGAVLVDTMPEGGYQTKGIMKLYFEDKGFGFVSPDDGMKDIFVHKSCMDQCGVAELHPGQAVRVTFNLTEKGREAIKVEIEGTP